MKGALKDDSDIGHFIPSGLHCRSGDAVRIRKNG